jgi:stage II sporulation protein AA (anti-sigma F factor antagonist)
MHIRDCGDRIRITAAGELDLATAPQLDAALTEVEGMARPVELDLGALTFMDSSGINLLIRHARRADGGGPALAIVPPPPRVARVLDVAGVTELLPFVSGSDGAAAEG